MRSVAVLRGSTQNQILHSNVCQPMTKWYSLIWYPLYFFGFSNWCLYLKFCDWHCSVTCYKSSFLYYFYCAIIVTKVKNFTVNKFNSKKCFWCIRCSSWISFRTNPKTKLARFFKITKFHECSGICDAFFTVSNNSFFEDFYSF